MGAVLKISEGIRRLLEVIALTSGWLLVIMACVTTFDVVARKFGMQLPYTKLQELEWHFHAAIFSLWMGYCYTINAHPRVDTFTEHLTHRGRAWIELGGCLVLALHPTWRWSPTTAWISWRRPTGSASNPTRRSG